MRNFLNRRLHKFLGDSALAIHNYEAAVKHYGVLYRTTKARFYTHSLNTVESAGKLAYALLRTQNDEHLDQAEALLAETHVTVSHLLEVTDLRFCEVDGLRGEVALRRGQYENARILLQRAIEGFDAAPGADTLRLVELLEHLETTCHRAGWTAQEQSLRKRINALEQAWHAFNEFEILDGTGKYHQH